MLAASTEELTAIDGIGPVICWQFLQTIFADEQHRIELKNLLGEVEIEQENFSEEGRIF